MQDMAIDNYCNSTSLQYNARGTLSISIVELKEQLLQAFSSILKYNVKQIIEDDHVYFRFEDKEGYLYSYFDISLDSNDVIFSIVVETDCNDKEPYLILTKTIDDALYLLKLKIIQNK